MQRSLELLLVFVCSAAVLFAAYIFLGNIAPGYDPEQNPINIRFKFGVGARNELDTFNGTFTKDLVIDGTATTRLILSQEELKRIDLFLEATDFFGLPSTFPFSNNSIVMPQADYYLKVQKGSTVKEVNWNTNSVIDAETQKDLYRIVDYLTSVISEKPEYRALPPPNGAYL